MFFLFFPQVTVADVSVDTEAEQILKTSVTEVFSVLSDKELSLEQKKRKLKKITNSVFGFHLMAKLSLGKENWSKLNPKQREEFASLSIELFHNFYSDKISLFRDVEIVFEPSIIENEKKVQVPTVALYNARKVSILYKMYNTKKDWKIYDIEIEGVSLIKTYRSQYLNILKNNNIEALLARLREQKENKKL